MDPADINLADHRAEMIVVGISASLFFLGILANAFLAPRVYLNQPQWLRGMERLAWRPWSIHNAFSLLALLILLSFAFGLISQGIMHRWPGTGEPSQGMQLVVSGLVIQLVTVALIMGVLRQRQLSWNAAFDLRRQALRSKLGSALLFYLAIMPLVVICAALSHAILNGLNIQPEQQELFKDLSKSMTPTMMTASFILAVVGAPITEEILFRGIALPVAAKYLGTVPAVIGVSLVFALVHVNLASTLPLFVLAIGLSLAYVYSQSIVVPIIMHACFNAVNLVMFYFLKQGGALEAVL